MNSTAIKIAAVGAALLCGIGLLALQSSRTATAYYKTLPEFLADRGTSDRAVRVNGYVAEKSIVKQAGEPMTFVLTDKAKQATLPVSYKEIVPDTFKDGAEVVVEGNMMTLPDGRQGFHASMLTAKCPSKYESAEKSGS